MLANGKGDLLVCMNSGKLVKNSNLSSLSRVASLADSLETRKMDMMRVYDELRGCGPPDTELGRNVDACAAVTSDMINIMYERLTGVSEEMMQTMSQRRLRPVHVWPLCFSTGSHGSMHSGVAAKQRRS